MEEGERRRRRGKRREEGGEEGRGRGQLNILYSQILVMQTVFSISIAMSLYWQIKFLIRVHIKFLILVLEST